MCHKQEFHMRKKKLCEKEFLIDCWIRRRIFGKVCLKSRKVDDTHRFKSKTQIFMQRFFKL